eukprot:3728521-Pleurochrysis_carterae.AAC.2
MYVKCAYDNVGQINGPGVRNQAVSGLYLNAPGALKDTTQDVSKRACMPPTLQCKVLLSYSPPCPEGE